MCSCSSDDNQGNIVDNHKCPFCRIPTPYTDEEENKRLKKRMEVGDAHAIYNLGVCYTKGIYGLPQDYEKAIELWLRAGELGNATSYYSIGCAYELAQGVEFDKKKAKHYWELAAMQGDDTARYNLGVMETHAGNVDRALKHFMIAVRDGFSGSLNSIKQLYSNDHATKEDYTKALQLYQVYLGKIKSSQRDEAALFDSEKYRYY